MNALQNYVGKGSYANRPTNRIKKNTNAVGLYSARELNYSYIRQCLNYLWSEGHITESEYERSTVIRVNDQSMYPRLQVGGEIVISLLDSSEYESVSNRLVAISLKTNPDKYVIGRMKEVDSRSIKLSFENMSFPDMLISRKGIKHVFHAICIHKMPLV